MKSTLIIDTETTGLVDPEVVSVAWLEVTKDLEILERYHRMFKPSKPIELGALATHHIMDEDLVDMPPSSTFALPPGTEYVIGHNVDYDWNAMGCPDVKRICTLAFARSLWPDLQKHTQGALLYHFDRANARKTLRNAHDAAADVGICRTILSRIMDEIQPSGWDDLWERCELARVPTRMWMGVHYGLPMNQVPRQYKNWALNNTNPDPYQAQALRS